MEIEKIINKEIKVTPIVVEFGNTYKELEQESQSGSSGCGIPLRKYMITLG